MASKSQPESHLFSCFCVQYGPDLILSLKARGGTNETKNYYETLDFWEADIGV